MYIVVNPGHAPNTPGKQSPDGSFKEYQWNAEVADILVDKLIELGFAVSLAKADCEKVSLTFPVQRCNAICNRYGADNVLFISIHVNAAGNGKQWMNARGWSIFTTRGKTKSDTLATCIHKAACNYFTSSVKIRTDYSDGDPDWESDFYVLSNTKCPAVLIEHFFMDNKEDLEYLKTPQCKNSCANVIVQGILEYSSL